MRYPCNAHGKMVVRPLKRLLGSTKGEGIDDVIFGDMEEFS